MSEHDPIDLDQDILDPKPAKSEVSWLGNVKPHVSCDEMRENKRSTVRRVLSYTAGAFLYGLGVSVVILSIWFPDNEWMSGFARDFCLLGAGSASSVIGYWFAERREERKNTQQTKEMT